MTNISLTLNKSPFSPQVTYPDGIAQCKNSVTNISRLGTFKQQPVPFLIFFRPFVPCHIQYVHYSSVVMMMYVLVMNY
jgi:hypothetical protein